MALPIQSILSFLVFGTFFFSTQTYTYKSSEEINKIPELTAVIFHRSGFWKFKKSFSKDVLASRKLELRKGENNQAQSWTFQSQIGLTFTSNERRPEPAEGNKHSQWAVRCLKSSKRWWCGENKDYLFLFCPDFPLNWFLGNMSLHCFV